MHQIGRRERQVEVDGDLRPQAAEVLRVAEPALAGDDLELEVLAVREPDPLACQPAQLRGGIAQRLLDELARDRDVLVPAGQPRPDVADARPRLVPQRRRLPKRYPRLPAE